MWVKSSHLAFLILQILKKKRSNLGFKGERIEKFAPKIPQKLQSLKNPKKNCMKMLLFKKKSGGGWNI